MHDNFFVTVANTMPKAISLIPIVVGVSIIFVALKSLINLRLTSKKSWAIVTGCILSSQALRYRIHNVESKNYHAEVSYEYLINGEKFSKTAVIFRSSGDLNHAQNYVDRYRPNQEIVVYYDPKNVKLSVLDPRIFKTSYPLVFIIVGLLGFGIFCVLVSVLRIVYNK